MSETKRRQESILLLDVGTCNTKVVLLDLVEGQYGLVASAQAPSTVHEPWQNLARGAVEAISQLEEVCGRSLLSVPEDALSNQSPPADRHLITPEDEDGRGVDRLLVVSSAGEPLHVLLVGLVHDVSLASARHAVHSTYARVQGVLAVEQRPKLDRQDAGRPIDAVINSDADLVMIVGGTDAGAGRPTLQMVQEVVRVALYLMGSDAPEVLYAGNPALVNDIAGLLSKVTKVQVADNVRPTVQVEDITPAAQELNSLFYEKRMRTLPGLRTIRQWTHTLVLPTVRATETAIRCCAQVFDTGKPALGVDLGSAKVALHIAQDHRVRTAVRSDLGIGHSLLGLLDHVGAHEILRWLPFELDETALLDWLYHKARHPQTLPQTQHDLLIELSAARELIRAVLADLLPTWQAETELSHAHGQAEDRRRKDGRPLIEHRPAGADRSALGQGAPMAPPCDPIVGSGSLLARAPHPGLAALVLLDALQPLGISALYQDESGLLPTLGSAANTEPLATVQMLQGEGLLYLGTAVAPLGQARVGARAVTVRAPDAEAAIEQEVRYGELCVIPASRWGSSSEPSTLELLPTRSFDLGQGRGKRIQISCTPGALGLIVDARGRPLQLASEANARREQMNAWHTMMTGERGR